MEERGKMEITPYDFSGKTVRILTDDKGNPWWIATDVCRVLGLTNPREAISSLKEYEKSTVRISDGQGGPKRNIITEPGLYRLLLRSTKKRAAKFQRWIFHDVLPEIRKTGSYSIDIPKTLPEALRAYATAIEAKEELLIENKKLQDKNKELKPKADAYNQVSDSTGLTCLSDAAKIIGLKPQTFTALLGKDKYLFVRRGKLVPTQKYIDKGLLKEKLVPARDGSKRTYRQSFVTPRGVNKFRELYNPRQLDLFT